MEPDESFRVLLSNPVVGIVLRPSEHRVFPLAGADRFVFAPGKGGDWVVDFNSGEGDRVELPTGTAYQLISVEGQPVIVLADGSPFGFAGVTFASFNTNWIVYA